MNKKYVHTSYINIFYAQMLFKAVALVILEYWFVFDRDLRTMFLWRKMQINTRKSRETS